MKNQKTYLTYAMAIILALLGSPAFAADLTQEMDSLGANKELMKKASAIDPDNKMQVVQKREVDRDMRLELGLNYGLIATGGDPFLNTTSLGGQMDFHITPRWSLGARYYNYTNSYSAEGRAEMDYANLHANDPSVTHPAISYPKDSYMGVINWYPVYGKINFFDSSIIQFDLYALAGGGVIDTDSGSSPLYTAGAGIGVWLTKHLATRLEGRWQGYQDRVFDGLNYSARAENEMILTLGISFLL